MTKTVLQPVLLPEVANAVNFLNDVSERGFQEGDLKKYLMNSRGLNSEQVDKAFQIHLSRLKVEEKSLDEQRRSSMPMPPTNEEETRVDALARDSGDRPEIASRNQENRVNKKSSQASIFLSENQIAVDKLVKDFLRTEKSYCSKLRCLKEDYYKELAQMAHEKRFQMSRQEIDEIFSRVPQMCDFHKAFYNDMSCEFNIGRIFVRLFNFFKRYVAYMKDCTGTINKMREYTKDTDLHSCLERIRERTIFKRQDMMDLLLVPLKRISEYAEFLETLYKLADASIEAEYEYLGKASRRIGRVATYINKYKDGIWNRNEMNKIQQFLGSQCDIIAPYRRIVRRGMMIRRTSGWTARNKNYIFFLFNDILLWTSIRGNLQNLVYLRNSEVLPSDAKLDSERKFRIISRGQRYKSLLLECETVKQRNEWYVAVESKISAAKKPSAEVWSKNEFTSNIVTEKTEKDEDEKGYVRQKVKNTSGSSSPLSRIESEDQSGQKSQRKKEVTSPVSPEPVSSYHRRYQLSHNFKEQELQSFEPFEDTVSVVSESDAHELTKYEDINSTTSLMSPFSKQNHYSGESFDDESKQEMNMCGSSQTLNPESRTRSDFSEHKGEDCFKENRRVESNSPKSKIRRASSPSTSSGQLWRSSMYTIRLNHLNKS